MADTKEKILLSALRLFAQDGYEAVSVSAIAGELGMTKGALYKHYKNKRDIFDCLVERIMEMDVERAKEYELPEATFAEVPFAYRNTSLKRIKMFVESQLYFWTENEFACNFRRMLTLEQYRNPEMTDLYQKIFASGPVSYIEDLFREMMEQGVLKKSSSRLLALEFYAPLYLLMNISDASSDHEGWGNLLTAHMDDFIKINANN